MSRIDRDSDPEKKDSESFVQSDRMQSYLRYSGMAFELLGVVAFAAVLGQLLDRWIGTNKPYFTAALVLLFFISYMIRLFYQTATERGDSGEHNDNA